MEYLGIVSCQILELEFAHLLIKDNSIGEIRIVASESSAGLVERLVGNGDERVKQLSSLEDFRPSPAEGRGVLIDILKLGLHTVIKDLKDGVVQAATAMSPHVGAILLGYGLCGNALQNHEQLLEDCGVPIVIPMEKDHPVDDCVGLLIGGREPYYEEQCKCAGTMFMNSGFARHWKQMLRTVYGGEFKSDISKRLFANYKRSLMITTDVMDAQEMEPYFQEFNEEHNLVTESRPGTLEILENTWRDAKKAAFELPCALSA
jgi:Protein of unknown function (DUF1638)